MTEKPIYADIESGELYKLDLNPGLTEEERRDAKKLRSIARGVMFVVGPPGSGKGVWMTTLAFKLRRYFSDRKVFLDYFPKEAFDRYALPYKRDTYQLFNASRMNSELNKMALEARTEIGSSDMEDEDEELTPKQANKQSVVSNNWVKSNETLLKNGVWCLDELKKYLHKRRPNTRYGITIGMVCTVWRHLDLLIMGATPFQNEIDRFSWEQYVTCVVNCSQCVTKPFTTEYHVTIGRTMADNGVYEVTHTLQPIFINGREPRPELGMWLPGTTIPRRFLNGMQKCVIDTVQETPGISMPEVADKLHTFPDNIREEIDHLVRRGNLKCGDWFSLHESKDIKDLRPRL